MDSFDRMIQLLKKTGDRCIILNSKGEPEYVIVTLVHYHELLARDESKAIEQPLQNLETPTLFALADELRALKEAIMKLQEGVAPFEASPALAHPKGPGWGGLPRTGLTEGELLDKINRDIALWKERQKTKEKAFTEWDTMMERIHSKGGAREGEDEEHADEAYEPEPLE